MNITGTGTQGDPFIVHSYDEFISLNNHAPIGSTNALYIKFFDEPNQVIDCNEYGSEFTWGQYGSTGLYGQFTVYIDLNGCTIKNFKIKSDETMFRGQYFSYNGAKETIVVKNGSFRNVFLGSATSKVCTEYVEFHDVSISINVSGTTVTPFGDADTAVMDNCALYLEASTLATGLMNKMAVSDTDIELHVGNQNGVTMFPNCSFTDCRVQGKISGNAPIVDNSTINPMGALITYYSYEATNWINCVIDIDFTGNNNSQGTGTPFSIIYAYNTGINTNVICKSHVPQSRVSDVPAGWNYMTHEQIRNGTYLNNAGFTVVEVAGS